MKLFHETYGFETSDAPVVVLLNGLTQTTAHWRAHAKALAESFRVVTYDARGQGKTPIGDEAITMALHARDLAALLEDLGVERASLVGFSHGARVALGYSRHFPERVERLMLVSATVRPSALARTIIRSWREVLALGGMEAMAWAALPAILGEQYLRDNSRFISGIVKASVDRNDADGVRRLLEALVEYSDLEELASEVRCPTMVVSADGDLLVDRDGAEELARLCGGRHVEITGSGHTLPIEKPREFRAAVVEFLVS